MRIISIFRRKAAFSPAEQQRYNLHHEAMFGWEKLCSLSYDVNVKINALGTYTDDIQSFHRIEDDLVTIATLLKRHREVQSELKHY